MSKPKRGGVQHRGRVTIRTAGPGPMTQRRHQQMEALTESAADAIARSRVPLWQRRLQAMIDVSPAAAAAAAQLGASMAEPAPAGTAAQMTCPHSQASSADELPYSDPAKTWRCNSCGLVHRWTDGRLVPA